MEITSITLSLTVARPSNLDRIEPEFIKEAVEASLEDALGELQAAPSVVEVGEVIVVDIGDFTTTRNGLGVKNLDPRVRDGISGTQPALVPEVLPALPGSPGLTVVRPQPGESIKDFVMRAMQEAASRGRGQERVQLEKLLTPRDSNGGVVTSEPFGPHGPDCECPWPDDQVN